MSEEFDIPNSNNKHPKELYRLALTASGICFSYYGILAMLIAYLVTQKHLPEKESYSIFGTFNALTWGLPVFGGFIADRLLGKRKSMIWGAFLCFSGLSCLVLPYNITFFIGLAFFVTGSGFFNGTNQAFLAEFYRKEDQEGKDSGYTIYYGLFNAGSAIGGFICGYLSQNINWRLGFGAAAIGALVAFIGGFGINRIHGAAPDFAKLKRRNQFGINIEILIYILSLPFAAVIAVIFYHPSQVMDSLLPLLLLGSFAYIIYLSFTYSKSERYKLFAALISFLGFILFLGLYDQCFGSINLFILRNMNMRVAGITLPGLAINGFLPGFLPAIMMPLILYIWRRLRSKKLEPGSILKFAIGFLFMAAFFSVFWLGCKLYSGTGLVPVYFLFGGYILLELSELCIGPIIFSLTGKLSPGKISATLMGVLGVSGACGQYVSSKIGSLTSIPANIINPVITLPYYTKIFGGLALLSAGTALVFILLRSLFKRLMQDVI